MATTSSQPQKTEADPQRTAVRPGLSAPWITAYVGVGLLTLLVSLRLTLANSGTELADAGGFVRWALPISEVIHKFLVGDDHGCADLCDGHYSPLCSRCRWNTPR